jgi:hypothetical protein
MLLWQMSSALITLTITLIVCFFKRTWLFKLTTIGYAVVRLRALAALLSARLISNRPKGKEGQTNNRVTASKIKFL